MGSLQGFNGLHKGFDGLFIGVLMFSLQGVWCCLEGFVCGNSLQAIRFLVFLLYKVILCLDRSSLKGPCLESLCTLPGVLYKVISQGLAECSDLPAP